jgi:hypothetical protein
LQARPTELYLAIAAAILSQAWAEDSSRRFEDFTTDPQMGELSAVVCCLIRFRSRGRTLAGAIRCSLMAQRGEIGGWIQRSLTPASFAKVIPTRTLNDRLSASGKFAVTRDDSTSGTLFGWFHETSRGWRTPNLVVFRLDGNGGKYWVFYEYGTRHWLTGGGGCFEGDRYQTTPTKPFKADGTTHTWSLDYDPAAADGNGLMTFVLDGKVYPQPLARGTRLMARSSIALA